MGALGFPVAVDTELLGTLTIPLLVLFLAAALAFFTSRRVEVLYAGTTLMALGNGLMWPSLLSIPSKASDLSTQGAVQGLAGPSE